jgi:hypothetical protein
MPKKGFTKAVTVLQAEEIPKKAVAKAAAVLQAEKHHESDVDEEGSADWVAI